MRAENMTNNGKALRHQIIIHGSDGEYFQSYGVIVAKVTTRRIYLDRTHWDKNATTRKYREQFLMESTETTRNKIDRGIYTLADLNES